MGCGASKSEVSPQEEDDFDEAGASVIAIIANIPVLGFVFNSGGVIPVVAGFFCLLESVRKLFYEARAITNSAKDVVDWAEATRDAFAVLKDALASKADAPLEKAVLIHVKIAEECIHKLFSRSTYIAAGCSTLAAYIKSASFIHSFKHARERVAEAESRLNLMISVLGNAKHDTTHAKLDANSDKLAKIEREQESFRRDFLKIDEVKLEAASTKLKLNASTAAFFKTGVALLRCDVPAAIEVFRGAVDKDQEMSHAWLLLSLAFEREHGPCQDALDASYNCIKYIPSSSSTEYRSFCYLTLDILLFNLRDTYDVPEETYRKAIKLNQGDAARHLFLTHLSLGTLLYKKRDPSGAEYHLRKGIEIESTHEKTGVIFGETDVMDVVLGEVRYNLGVILLERDDCAAAAKEFREAAKLKPENPEYRRMNDEMPSIILMGEQKDKGWSFDSMGRWGPPEKP